MPSNPKCLTPAAFLSTHARATQRLGHAPRPETSTERITFTLDAAGNFTYINAAAERLTGYSCEEARRINVTELLSPQFAEQIRPQLRHNLRRRLGTVYEVEVVTRDGRHVTLEASVDLVRQSDRSVEIQGLAIETATEPPGRPRPRCLDQEFAFN